MARSKNHSTAVSSSSKFLPKQEQIGSTDNTHDDAKVAALSTDEISQVDDTSIQEIKKSSPQNAALTKREDVDYSTGQNEQTLGASTPLKKEESKDELPPNSSSIVKSEAPDTVKSEALGIKYENESVNVDSDQHQNSIITIGQYQIILTGSVSNVELLISGSNQNHQEENKIKCERANGTEIPFQIKYKEKDIEGKKESLSESKEIDQDIHCNSNIDSASVSDENLHNYDEFQVQNDDDTNDEGSVDKGDSYTDIVSIFEVICLPTLYHF